MLSPPLLKVCLSLSLLLTGIFCQDTDVAGYETVTLKLVGSSENDLKEAANHLPPKLRVSLVTQDNQTIKFKLKRYAQSKRDFSVYRIRNGSLQAVHLPDMTPHVSMYRDFKHHGFFKVKDTQSGSLSGFSINGNFIHNGSHYDLTAFPGQPSYFGHGVHTIKKMDSLGSFEGDILHPPGGSSGSQTRRKERCRNCGSQVMTNRFIELTMVTDYPIYHKFLELAHNIPRIAEAEMKEYYGFIAASIDRRYQTISEHFPNVKIRVVLKQLIICDDPSECPWATSHVLDGNKISYPGALPAFTTYMRQSPRSLGDHSMYFTGYRMATAGGTVGALGVAYVSAACGDWSGSMVQERYSGITAGLAAHELGHSFSAHHDNHGSYTGCSNQHYVMNSYASFPSSGELASRPYYFSNCSADSIASFVTSNSGSCTINNPRQGGSSNVPAGQYFNSDLQCTIYYGAGSTFCRGEQKERGFHTMCSRTRCTQLNGSPTCGAIIPLFGTSCGNGAWCVQGVCVKAIDAPNVPENCPQGDDPTVTCDMTKCNSGPLNRALCCRTCHSFETDDVPDMTSSTSTATTTATATTTTTTTATTTTSTEEPECNRWCRCVQRFPFFICWFILLATK